MLARQLLARHVIRELLLGGEYPGMDGLSGKCAINEPSDDLRSVKDNCILTFFGRVFHNRKVPSSNIFSVLRLMQISDSRLEQRGSKNLEIGFIFFFDQFRRIYIGEQVNRPSSVSDCTIMFT